MNGSSKKALGEHVGLGSVGGRVQFHGGELPKATLQCAMGAISFAGAVIQGFKQIIARFISEAAFPTTSAPVDAVHMRELVLILWKEMELYTRLAGRLRHEIELGLGPVDAQWQVNEIETDVAAPMKRDLVESCIWPRSLLGRI